MLIDQAQYEALEELQKVFFVAGDEENEGKWLMLNERKGDTDDTGVLQRAFERQKATNVKLRAELDEIKSNQAKAIEDKLEGDITTARKANDIETLTKQWEKREKLTVESAIKPLEEERANLRRALNTALVESHSRELAGPIALTEKQVPTIADAMSKRMELEMHEDGTFTRHYLDQDGGRTAMNSELFTREFQENESWAPMMKGSGASGGRTENSDNTTERIEIMEASGGGKGKTYQQQSPKELLATLKEKGLGS